LQRIDVDLIFTDRERHLSGDSAGIANFVGDVARRQNFIDRHQRGARRRVFRLDKFIAEQTEK